ncbi:RDD family protein [Mycolicibacterium sp. S2-37]|uniref:RDD family protein n=1 Tax=Mycolicibacterium sp. S2-37 TaxID=2810297 RepID=UPI001A944801|nr:RDD family protein [Mycolicibacterium sp. S2-37]MBO0678560.1 RDD family protein [Mycolicibacterium sp. S2-37]
MTAVLDPVSDEPVVHRPTERVAEWHTRAGALAVDVLPGLAVLGTTAPWLLVGPQLGWLWWIFAVIAALTVVAMAANRWLLPSTTGWSLGRALFRIRVVRRDGAAMGFGRLLVRDLAHLLDTAALFVGWLWPLWDGRRRTFADMLLRTEVRPAARPERDIRRLTAEVLAVAVAASVLAVGLNYLVVYRHQQAVDQARAQIVEQGPRIVEQLLSYSTDTIDEDFARAQTLTTDSYREQLVSQQEAVRKAGPSTNEYWAVTSAVLPNPPVTTDRAAMLLAMQGQRGTKVEDLKFITATVRVDFVKVGDDWRVDNLTVLKKPLMQGGGQ